MSIHKSLHIDKFKNKKKSVRTRLERIRKLLSKGKKIEEIDLYSLPKEKVIKMKAIKKEIKKPEEHIDLLKAVEEKKKEVK